MFDDDGEVTEINVQWELRGIEWTIGEGQRSFVGHVEDVRNRGEIALGVLASDVILGILDALFRGSEKGGAVCSLHGYVGFGDALGNGGVSPELNAVGAVERVAHCVVEMIVGVERADGGGLSDFAKSVHLKSGAARRAETFEEKAGVLADKKATVADGGETLGGVGDGCIKAITDFAD